MILDICCPHIAKPCWVEDVYANDMAPPFASCAPGERADHLLGCRLGSDPELGSPRFEPKLDRSAAASGYHRRGHLHVKRAMSALLISSKATPERRTCASLTRMPSPPNSFAASATAASAFSPRQHHQRRAQRLSSRGDGVHRVDETLPVAPSDDGRGTFSRERQANSQANTLIRPGKRATLASEAATGHDTGTSSIVTPGSVQ